MLLCLIHSIVTNLITIDTQEKVRYLPLSVTVLFDQNLNTNTKRSVAGSVSGEPEARGGKEEGGSGAEVKPCEQPDAGAEGLP